MRHSAAHQVIQFPVEHNPDLAESMSSLGDLRFRNLLDTRQWAALPARVRERFSKRMSPGQITIYSGEIVECKMSWAGRVVAHLLRPVGAPLPLCTDTMVPATVVVTEDMAGTGQFWTRIYGQIQNFPQTVQSHKRFAGPTGLEEFIGYGLGMALSVSVKDAALHFYSEHYFVRFGPYRLQLPGWMTPGSMTVSHIDLGDDWFAFKLLIEHGLFGQMLRQTILFKERP